MSASEARRAKAPGLRRLLGSLRWRFQLHVASRIEEPILFLKRALRRAKQRWASRADDSAVAMGSLLVGTGTRLMLRPHRSERIEIPQPLTIGGHVFDVAEDLEEYTQLSRSQVRSLLERRIENFRTEWHSFPRAFRDDVWFYRSSRLYLFANAIHINETIPLLEIIHEATPTPSRMLEFGGGAGHLSLALASQGFHVDYTELSALQKDFVRFRISKHGLTDRVHVLDSWSEIPKAAYQVVCAIDVLEHLPDLQRTLEDQLLPSLASGAVLIEQSPFVQGTSNPMHHLDDEGLDEILGRHGLVIVREHPLCRVWKRTT